MKYRILTDKESKDFVKSYYTLRESIDTLHTEAVAILERKYQEYVQTFNPKVLYIFTRKLLTFDEFISGIASLGYIMVTDYNNKRYLDVAYCFSAKNIHNVLKLNEKEASLIEYACNYGLDIYKKHNKYINRMQRYAANPFHLDSEDLDNLESYIEWNADIQNELLKYNTVP